MPSGHTHSGDLSQNSGVPSAHHTPVPPTSSRSVAPAPTSVSSVSGAARSGRQFYNVLSASSIGLELGLSVVLGVLLGRWLDGRFGTTPWLMILFLAFGLVAGFRGVMRAVRRAERAAEAEAHHG